MKGLTSNSKIFMIGLFIALAIVLGAGGTAVVSDNARPGDALFGVDRAVENMRISFAGDEKKNELRIRFAKERVEEIEDLVQDENVPVSMEISDLTVSAIEADIFTNETVVKIEHNDQKTVFLTEAKTRETVVTALIAQYPSLTRAFIEKTISIEFEDRASRNDDKVVGKKNRSLSAEEQANVSAGIEVALNLLAGLKEQQEENPLLDDIVSRLNAYVTDLPSNTRVEVDDDKLQIKFEDDDGSDGSGDIEIKEKNKNGESKIEIKTDQGRIKIEVKDGVLEIKTRLDDDSSDDDNKAVGLEEVEAEILSDKTIVKVEFNDEETTFTTSATSREAIVAAIIAKFPSLTSAQVDAILKIETEDDDSDKIEESDKDESSGNEDDDNNDDSGKDDDGDDDSDDDNEDEDDSNSGSGRD